MRTLIILAFLLGMNVLHAQSILGKWNTFDDRTGENRSTVEFYEKGGRIYGKIIGLASAEDAQKTCTLCTDDRKNKPIIGLEIVRGMAKKSNLWQGGTILDPEDGKAYTCKIWLEEGNLKVRGYVGVFYRTQTWKRVE
ncbi:MAG: DUF2147 domain-containing protein [Saprospiraceae bacterium]|nr:DUF2147 domain-containing protein [Saprospiraceae bacterium]